MTDIPEQRPAADPGDDDHIVMDEIDREAVSRVIARVKLSDVRMRHSHAEVNDDLPPDWQDKAYLLWRVDFIGRAEDAFITEIGYLVRYYEGFGPDESPKMPTGDDAPEPVLEVQVDFDLFYELTDGDGLSDRDLRHFSMFNGTQNAWGYMREFVQSMTARMGVTPYVAPVLPVPAIASGEAART